MFLELEKAFTKKLKIKLVFKICIVFGSIISILFFCHYKVIKINNFAKKIENQTFIQGKINSYEWLENQKIKIEVTYSKLKIIGYYNYEEQELKELKNIIKIGNQMELTGALQHPESNTIPNTFSYQNYLKSQKIFYIMKIDKIILKQKANIWNRGKDFLIKHCEKSIHQTYLKRLLLGLTTNQKQEMFRIYQKNGISHIFAISGMHFYIIYHFLNKWIRKKVQKEKNTLLLTFLILSIYYFLLFPSISSTRAYIMLGLITLKKYKNIKISNKILFLICLIIHLLINPLIIWNISFYYSYLLSFCFLTIISERKNKRNQILMTSIMVFLFSLPITVTSSFCINPWTILNNIIWIPFITTILFPVLILHFFLPSLSVVSSMILKILEEGNKLVAMFPCSNIIMPKTSIFVLLLYYFLLVMIYYLQKKRWIILLGCVLFFWKIAPKLDANGYIYFLDVGQGDCAVIISPFQKEVLLIDTGPESQWLQNNLNVFLNSLGIHQIDLAVLSHGDFDHAGNILGLLSHKKIQKILLNQGSMTEIEQKIQENYPEKIIEKYDSKQLEFHQLNHKKQQNENENSTIIQVCIWNRCTLFMGDASQKVEKELITNYQINATILKVGHHGSNTSTSNDFLDKIPFQIGIISAGRNNFYHHPHENVLNRLKEKKIEIYNTQTNGTITLKINAKGFTIKTTPP